MTNLSPELCGMFTKSPALIESGGKAGSSVLMEHFSYFGYKNESRRGRERCLEYRTCNHRICAESKIIIDLCGFLCGFLAERFYTVLAISVMLASCPMISLAVESLLIAKAVTEA
jgi:hypothetical protein